MKYPCVENTIDVTYGDITVRLWINRPSKTPVKCWEELHVLYNTGSVVPYNFCEYVMNEIRKHPEPKDLIKALSSVAVNAIQVMKKYTTFCGEVTLGTVVYTVPFEDVHG